MTSEFSVAVHALVFLNHKAKTISSEEISENICTNPARVRKIMSKLKKANLIETKEGIEGGYSFNLNASNVSLKDVSKALNISFVSSSWKSGDVDMNCLIASGMANVMDNIYSKLDNVCKDYLNNITISDIDKIIFKKES